MGKDKEVEQRGLWDINEVTIYENYQQGEDNGRVYYRRVTSRSDLPQAFWHDDWQFALELRERDEQQAVSSANAARTARRVYGGRLISQEIANNPSLGIATSSAQAAQQRRGKGKYRDDAKKEKK